MWNLMLTYLRATHSWSGIKKWGVRVAATYLATLMGAFGSPLLRAKFLSPPWLIGSAVLLASYAFTGWAWAKTTGMAPQTCMGRADPPAPL